MGKVNDYIKKILKMVKFQGDKKKPWLKYYKDMPEHLNYFRGSIYDYVNEAALENEMRIAYKYYGTSVTYRTFIRKIDKVAQCLLKLSVVENECVTICMPNTPESVILFYAINKIGAIANIVHPLSSAQDIKNALKETNSSVLFCSDVAMPKARNIKVKHFIMVPISNSLTGIKKFVYNLKCKSNLEISSNMIAWTDFINNNDEVFFETYKKRKDTDPAAIIYSGGTTGKSKGIIISNLNFNAMAQQTRSVCKYIRPGYSVLSALPIFHVFGLSVCLHTCLGAGMTCIILPRLDTKRIARELMKHKPNVFPCVPSLLKMIIAGSDPGRNAFRNTKIIVCGGDYLSEDVRKQTEKYFMEHGSSAKVKIGYGLSESTGFSCCTSVLSEHLDSLGIPNPDMDLVIVEPGTDILKGVSEIGEICVSGPTIMMGYINEDIETKKTLVTHQDGKVWLHTGDLGYMDSNGIFYYTSRLKRMIISNGYNIYPIELENIINKCKYVENCTVVAMSHKIKNQVPKAVVVLKEGVENCSKIRMEIKKYCQDNIAKYAVPYEFEYRESLPRTAVGKVAYKKLENNKE